MGLLAATVFHRSGVCLARNALLGFEVLPSGRPYTARVGYFWILNVIMSMSMSLTLTLTFFFDITLVLRLTRFGMCFCCMSRHSSAFDLWFGSFVNVNVDVIFNDSDVLVHLIKCHSSGASRAF